MSKQSVAAWAYLSSRGTTTYEVVKYDDGSYSCNCPGWLMHPKAGNVRNCKHCKRAAAGDFGDFFGDFEQQRPPVMVQVHTDASQSPQVRRRRVSAL